MILELQREVETLRSVIVTLALTSALLGGCVVVLVRALRRETFRVSRRRPAP